LTTHIRATVLATLLLAMLAAALIPLSAGSGVMAEPGVAVLMVDTDRKAGTIDRNIYGQFLEHINHAVVDGLFAEQIRGAGFEAEDFATYWTVFGNAGAVRTVSVPFEQGTTSVRVAAGRTPAGIRQDRVHLQSGLEYSGSAWLKVESGRPRVSFRVRGADGALLREVPLAITGTAWREVPYAFSSPRTDTAAVVEIAVSGSGAVLVDFVSLMRADVRADGMLRPDLLDALRGLAPTFIRWPGGSFASTYKWKDGIGPHAARTYHPNVMWGGYADYYGFGTDEFMGLTRRLGSDAMIVLPAPDTDPASVQYAMDWVHYLIDPPTTEWGARRAANGHPDPYDIRYFQIDNEPMNNGFTAERYAEVVNVYGRQLRQIAPRAAIVACGQKRSNDMVWSQTVIDLAGDHFDILGVHNYEYESDRFESGVRRIGDYLVKLRDYVRASAHPAITIAVLEWNLSRTYDWRAGLHAAGSLMRYESLGPEVTMTAPALLMRNTTDDPTWTAFIYHDHVSWFPGAAYVVQKLFREHYAETYLASSSGTFRDIDRPLLFDEISTAKPEAWEPGTVDALATASADGRRMVIKAVNYDASRHTLLARLQGSKVPADAIVTIHTISAAPTAAASLAAPDTIRPVARSVPWSRNLTIELEPHSVVVVAITAR
jgi:alpha-L-arabinofuranosidase